MRYVLKLCFDGAAYSGFQRQAQAKTVQGEVEKELSRIFREPIETDCAGRTDTGVHGLGQVVAFSSLTYRPLKAVLEAVNGRLDDGIRLLQGAILPLGNSFHPRFDAKSRTYSYLVLADCDSTSSALWRSRVWCVRGEFDPEAAKRASLPLLGTHDFVSFSSHCDMPSTVRELREVKIEILPPLPLVRGQMVKITVTANAFIRRMVRLLVAGMVEVGLGLRPENDLAHMLEQKNPGAATHPAPPTGLYFDSIEYRPDPFSPNGPAQELYRARTRRGVRMKKSTR